MLFSACILLVLISLFLLLGGLHLNHYFLYVECVIERFLNHFFSYHSQSVRVIVSRSLEFTWNKDLIFLFVEQTLAEAVGDWYFKRAEAKHIDCQYPCNPTCYHRDLTLRWWDGDKPWHATVPSLAAILRLVFVVCTLAWARSSSKMQVPT